MFSAIGKLFAIVFGVVLVLGLIAFLLAIMSNGIIIAWNWGELGILFGLTRPLLFSHIFAGLLVWEFVKLPVVIKMVTEHLTEKLETATAKRDELDSQLETVRANRASTRRAEENTRRLTISLRELEGLLSKWR